MQYGVSVYLAAYVTCCHADALVYFGLAVLQVP